jgi:catechol 2,3-dioxygenase-like lactoylglutathione lyase family enzyme
MKATSHLGVLTAVALALFTVLPAMGQTETNPDHGATTMKVRDLYPLVTTPALGEVRDFYVSHFDFTVAFEASWFVYLVGPAEEGARGATLAFMHPDHPSNPPGPEEFNGLGMILTLEVSDAAMVFEEVKDDVPIVHPLTHEAWGQRRFMTRDPAGVLIDVVEQIEPARGFWDQYMTVKN